MTMRPPLSLLLGGLLTTALVLAAALSWHPPFILS